MLCIFLIHLQSDLEPKPSHFQPEVIREVIAVYDYTGQYEDELTFSTGDKIQVTVESKLIEARE